jgi:phage terminase small subunit
MSRKRLTLKQERFIAEYIKDGNATRAVRQAYPNIKTENARWQMAHRLVRNSKVLERMAEISEENGLGIEELISSIKEGLEAKKPLLVNGKIILVDDNKTQMEAIKLLYRLHGFKV